MLIETVGKFQMHLSAHELTDASGWDPFVRILKFDDQAQDFIPVLEKRHAGAPCDSYQEAIEAARRLGNDFLLHTQRPEERREQDH